MNQAGPARVRVRSGHLVRHSPAPARPLAGRGGPGCAARCGSRPVAVACLVVGTARPAPLILGLALVLLLSIPWGYAVARRLANPADPAR
jgi:hypothetical protein